MKNACVGPVTGTTPSESMTLLRPLLVSSQVNLMPKVLSHVIILSMHVGNFLFILRFYSMSCYLMCAPLGPRGLSPC